MLCVRKDLACAIAVTSYTIIFLRTAAQGCYNDAGTQHEQKGSPMRITLLGAAGEVTGSAYHVATKHTQVLIDFGMFQGRSADERRNRVPRELNPRQLAAVVLTHAHLDHSGRLPLLVRRGYRGPIYATPATIEVAELLLEDAARIQAFDAERTNRKRRRAGRAPVQPLFTDADVQQVLGLFEPLPYDRAVTVAPGVMARMIEAGHILGSASIELIVTEQGRDYGIVFSGDIGPQGAPILKDPGLIKDADVVFLESTYGDRDHRSLDATIAELTDLVRRAADHWGKILVPAFAVGRSQQIIYHLGEMFRASEVAPFPIYLDSPMAIKATNLYKHHPELYDEKASAMREQGKLWRDLDMLHTCETSAESRALNDLDGPCLIIAGSGMCTGGRILHHLKHNLWRRETVVLLVGYQGAGTLGRLLADGAKRVRIFGDEIAVRAEVHGLGGFSAHAGQSELLQWLAAMARNRPRVVLVHGEDRGRQPLARLIKARFGIDAELPELNDVIEV